jgi:hypothetical protein
MALESLAGGEMDGRLNRTITSSAHVKKMSLMLKRLLGKNPYMGPFDVQGAQSK